MRVCWVVLRRVSIVIAVIAGVKVEMVYQYLQQHVRVYSSYKARCAGIIKLQIKWHMSDWMLLSLGFLFQWDSLCLKKGSTWSYLKQERYLFGRYMFISWSSRTIEKRKPSETLNLYFIPGVCLKEIHCAHTLRVKSLGGFKKCHRTPSEGCQATSVKWQISRWWLKYWFYHHISLVLA